MSGIKQAVDGSFYIQVERKHFDVTPPVLMRVRGHVKVTGDNGHYEGGFWGSGHDRIGIDVSHNQGQTWRPL